MKNIFLNTVLPLFVVFCLLTGCSAADSGGGSRSESQPAASGLNNTDTAQQQGGEAMSGYLNTQNIHTQHRKYGYRTVTAESTGSHIFRMRTGRYRW